MACFERDGEIGIDCDALFDWDGDFAGYGAAGGGASDVAGGDALDFGGGHFVVVDTCGVDWVLDVKPRIGRGWGEPETRPYGSQVKGAVPQGRTGAVNSSSTGQ